MTKTNAKKSPKTKKHNSKIGEVESEAGKGCEPQELATFLDEEERSGNDEKEHPNTKGDKGITPIVHEGCHVPLNNQLPRGKSSVQGRVGEHLQRPLAHNWNVVEPVTEGKVGRRNNWITVVIRKSIIFTRSDRSQRGRRRTRNILILGLREHLEVLSILKCGHIKVRTRHNGP